ncbi:MULTISPECIES: hypothetical protein [unclassified Streptomyces]|uniref:hypothetical protein n=1 Tax=unclassified Streptomyces TaxID=2593676 RepID=UPI002ED17ECF
MLSHFQNRGIGTRLVEHALAAADAHRAPLIFPEPWPLARGIVLDLQETLATNAGLSAPVGEPVVHFSSGVGPVRLGATRPARATRTSVVGERTLRGQ